MFVEGTLWVRKLRLNYSKTKEYAFYGMKNKKNGCSRWQNAYDWYR